MYAVIVQCAIGVCSSHANKEEYMYTLRAFTQYKYDPILLYVHNYALVVVK